MSKYILGETAEITLIDKTTGDIEYQGEVLTKDVEIVKTTFKFNKGHEYYDKLLEYVGEIITLGNFVGEKAIYKEDYKVTIDYLDTIHLTKIEEKL